MLRPSNITPNRAGSTRAGDAEPPVERLGSLQQRDALESKDVLKRRIDEAARYVPLEQLCLSPQCGFSSTVEGNNITLDDEIAKLRLVVETAREVWGG